MSAVHDLGLPTNAAATLPSSPHLATPQHPRLLLPLDPLATDSDIISHFALPPLHAKSPSRPTSISKPIVSHPPKPYHPPCASPSPFLLAPLHPLAPASVVSSFGAATVRPNSRLGLRAAGPSFQKTLQPLTAIRLKRDRDVSEGYQQSPEGSARTIVPPRVGGAGHAEYVRDDASPRFEGSPISGDAIQLGRVDEMEEEQCVFCGEVKAREAVKLKDCGEDGWQWACAHECSHPE